MMGHTKGARTYLKACPCGCGGWLIYPWVTCQCGALPKGDAQLIASAPDLLEALKGTLELIDTLVNGQYENIDKEYMVFVDDAEKAISKATKD